LGSLVPQIALYDVERHAIVEQLGGVRVAEGSG
jgi:hypothetical protein